jgi:hypothetical protein
MARKTSTIAAPEEAPVQLLSAEAVTEPMVTEPVMAEPVMAESVRPKPKTSGFLAGAILGVVAAGAGYGVATLYPLQKPVGQDLAPLLAQIDQLKAQVAALPDPKARLDQLEQAIKSTPDLGQITGQIMARLVALEARPSGVSAQMQADIAALQVQSKPFDPAPAVQAAIAAEMAMVQKSAAAMQADAQAAAAQATRTAQIALLRAALDTGAPYVSATDMADLPAVLAEHADTGLPSLMTLKDTWPDAARLALEAALRANMGGTWAERVTNFLRAQTGARALTPREGNDPDAILSRAEAALKGADLPRALAEIQSLPSEAQTALQDWIARATLRQSAIDALTALAAKKE